MDPSTASYYRAILFTDGLDQRPLPPTLVRLHQWAVKRNHALGLGGMLAKAVALNVAMTWLSSTKEGRAFAGEFSEIGDLFDGSEPVPLSVEEFDTLPAESPVLVTLNDKTKKAGSFIGRRGNWVDVKIDGEVKPFLTSKVQLAGV